MDPDVVSPGVHITDNLEVVVRTTIAVARNEVAVLVKQTPF